MKAPKLPSFFHSQRMRQFEYQPRYYDDDKARRKQRNAEIEKEANGERTQDQRREEYDPEAFRSNIRERWERSNASGTAANRASLRVIIIAAILLYFAYVFFY